MRADRLEDDVADAAGFEATRWLEVVEFEEDTAAGCGREGARFD